MIRREMASSMQIHHVPPFSRRPPPLPGESMSSWFERTAGALHLRPTQVAHALWPRQRRSKLDIDNITDPGMVAVVAEAFQLPPPTLREMLVAGYVEKLTAREVPASRIPWLVRRRTPITPSYDLQRCDMCLSDALPYRRLSWRFATTCLCTIHGVILSDPHFEDREMTSGVGSEFRAAADPKAIHLQLAIEGAVEKGWARLGSELLPSHQYFIILRQLLRIVATGARASGLRQVLSAKFGVPNVAIAFPTMKRDFETLNAFDRHCIFVMTAPLLQRWPNNFAEACRDARVWSSWVLGGCINPPEALQSALQTHLSGVTRPGRNSQNLASGEARTNFVSSRPPSWRAGLHGSSRPSQMRSPITNLRLKTARPFATAGRRSFRATDPAEKLGPGTQGDSSK